jgi:hypothetical protein
MTLGITALSIECRFAECHVLFIVMLCNYEELCYAPCSYLECHYAECSGSSPPYSEWCLQGILRGREGSVQLTFLL